MTVVTFKAWAIQLQKGMLAGRYHFVIKYGMAPKHLEGCHIALFDTRKEARKASKGTYYHSCVRQVAVQIKEM